MSRLALRLRSVHISQSFRQRRVGTGQPEVLNRCGPQEPPRGESGEEYTTFRGKQGEVTSCDDCVLWVWMHSVFLDSKTPTA